LKLAQGGSNQRAEIYCPKSGKNAGKWQMEVIKTFNANKQAFAPNWRKEFPDADLVMTLHRDDMVAYEEEGKTVIKRVRKLNSPDKAVFVDINRAKLDKNEGWEASANKLQEKKTRSIMVEIDGSVYDPLGILTTKRKVSVGAT
jgi:hypothetical protein